MPITLSAKKHDIYNQLPQQAGEDRITALCHKVHSNSQCPLISCSALAGFSWHGWDIDDGSDIESMMDINHRLEREKKKEKKEKREMEREDDDDAATSFFGVMQPLLLHASYSITSCLFQPIRLENGCRSTIWFPDIWSLQL